MPPTAEHEALHRVFHEHEDKELFTRAMARVFGIGVPKPIPGGVTILSNDLTETDPLERHPDSVLQFQFLIDDPDGKYILVLESQTEPKPERLRRWPHFISHLHDKYGCPVILAVLCNKAYTANWARRPIEISLHGLVSQVTYAIVFGPDNVPVITDPVVAAADLLLAVFSALTHSRTKAAGGIIEALLDALSSIDEETASKLSEFTEYGLADTIGGQIWSIMTTTMSYPFISRARREGRAEGVEAQRKSIYTVFNRRDIEVDEDSRQKIEECNDLDQLQVWFNRSFDAAKSSDLFEE
jgi:hypothetical protein